MFSFKSQCPVIPDHGKQFFSVFFSFFSYFDFRVETDIYVDLIQVSRYNIFKKIKTRKKLTGGVRQIENHPLRRHSPRFGYDLAFRP